MEKDFAIKIFEGFSIQRWNDLVRPFDLVEMDKAAEKMIIAYIIGKYEEKKGSPNPLLIEKKCGTVSMTHILTQILYLSQLHVGSTQKMRLPITIGYADKICKSKGFVPEGKMDDRLFFL